MKQSIGLFMLGAVLVTAAFAAGSISVESVIPGSAAEAAGLQAGDRLELLDGKKITNMDDLTAVTSTHEPGDTVPLIVQRDGETVELSLKFGKRPGGGVSIGVRLAIEPDPESAARGTAECLDWIEQTYRLESLSRQLELELAEARKTTLECVRHDTMRMTSENAVEYCDNIFKVHCSGLDLLTEIGEGLVQRCEQQIAKSLDVKPAEHKGWKTCGQHRVFDRYANDGVVSDAEACEAALKECESP